MLDRGAQPSDVKRAVVTALRAVEQLGDEQGPAFRLEGGTDLDGDPLVVVVREIQPGLFVITVL
jgi:hypothetical protein